MITVSDLPGLAKHLEARDPHDLGKGDVDLENVQNFALASTAEARAGSSNTKYMTPLLTKYAIEELTSEEGLANHLKASNPHNISKSTIGLDKVQNYTMSNAVEARAGTRNDVYMTPQRVKEAFEALVDTDALDNHLKASNPHSITKTTVGLSDVQNYAVASTSEAQAGTRTDRYMTPQRVKDAIGALVDTDKIDNHLKASNPHGITKTTVKLSNVQDYPMATQNDATNGTRTDRYMSPKRVVQAVEKYINSNKEPAEKPWTLLRSGTESGSFFSSVDLRGKEVCFISSDVSNIDEIAVVKGFIPLVSGFSNDLQCYFANGYSDIEYRYSDRRISTNGDLGNRQVWYREASENAYPPMGTIKA